MLQPQVILDVVSRIRELQGSLSRWLGFQPNKYNSTEVSIDGPNIVRSPTRFATFRYFDSARTVAKGRAPGTGPATIPVNPVGQVPVSCARFHMKIPLSYEELGNLSPIIGPNSNIDQGGQDYIGRMIKHIARRFNMTVELLSTGMIQDNLFWNYNGDDIVASIGPLAGLFNFQVPFQVPAGNKGNLSMLGTPILGLGWQNVASPIIKNLLLIDAAMVQLSGYSLTDVWINGPGWYNVIVNTEVRNTAGSANVPFAEFDREPEKAMDGTPTGKYVAVLKGQPNVRWHIDNDVIVTNSDIDPSYASAPASAVIQKVVPDNTAMFLTDSMSAWCKMYHGGEYVVENPGMPGQLRMGYYFWKEFTTQPSAVDLIGLLNCVPLLYVPKAVAFGTVVF